MFNATVLSIGLMVVGIVFALNSQYMRIEGEVSIALILATMGAYLIDAVSEKNK